MIKRIFLLFFLTLAISALAAPDSLGCRMIDWLDAPGLDWRVSNSDMAMGDSFLVWCPGRDIYYFVNPFSQTEVETVNSFDYGSENLKGVAIKDSICFLTGGPGIVSKVFEGDSLRRKDLLIRHFASFHYAVIRDTFLYTASTGSYGLHCINIANPESIFVAWTYDYTFGFCGLEVTDGFVHLGSYGEYYPSPPDESIIVRHWIYQRADISGDTAVGDFHMTYIDEAFYGDIATDGEYLFYVYSDMSPWVEGIMDFTVGNSHLGVWGEDYSYTWTEPDSEEVYGVEILSDTLIAVGFEHGFSILNYTNLDSIYEVAHYRDTDSVFAFTHFARKDTRIYAMAHPHPDTCRMYMFELDDNIWASIEESPNPAKPSAFTISAHPNPFNSAVTINVKFSPCQGGDVRRTEGVNLEIYDINGRHIKTLRPSATSGTGPSGLEKGGMEVPLLKGDLGGSFIWQPAPSLPSGVYLVRAQIGSTQRPGEQSTSKKIIYIK